MVAIQSRGHLDKLSAALNPPAHSLMRETAPRHVGPSLFCHDYISGSDALADACFGACFPNGQPHVNRFNAFAGN
jgi:hypothetical protein